MRRHYRLRGYRILAANVRAGGVELDLIVRRGERLAFCEVKAKEGEATATRWRWSAPRRSSACGAGRRRGWRRIPRRPELEVGFDVVAVRGRRVERVADAF